MVKPQETRQLAEAKKEVEREVLRVEREHRLLRRQNGRNRDTTATLTSSPAPSFFALIATCASNIALWLFKTAIRAGFLTALSKTLYAWAGFEIKKYSELASIKNYCARGRLLELKASPLSAIIDCDSAQLLYREIKNQNYLCHWHILTMHGSFYNKGDDSVYFILDSASGGNLQTMLCQKYFTPRQSAILIQMITSGIRYLHFKNRIHRNINPGNIVFDSYGRCKIANCGLAVHAPKSNSRRKNVCSVPFFERGNHPGTPLSYQAPEIIEGKPYDETVDIWALGVLIYHLLTGFLPFDAPSKDETRRRIMHVNLQFPSQMSSKAKCLIKNTLCRDPGDRLSADEVLKHPWLIDHVGEVYH